MLGQLVSLIPKSIFPYFSLIESNPVLAKPISASGVNAPVRLSKALVKRLLLFVLLSILFVLSSKASVFLFVAVPKFFKSAVKEFPPEPLPATGAVDNEPLLLLSVGGV
jgi:hypothetical protein